MIALRSPLGGASLLLALAGCAQIEIPPGGPEDRTPPSVVTLRPDTFSIEPGWSRPVVITFSERISEQQVEEAVMVSPRTSAVAVDRGSREIRVSLRRGWQPGQIYHVTVRPLIQDLFNNAITAPIQLIFSTGPEIPPTRLSGIVRDRITGEPEVDVRVEAIRRADSLVYAAPTDSAGRFVLAHIPEGDYLVRAFPDQNRNRMLDVFEKRDTAAAGVAVADTAAVEFSLVLPDTTPPQLASAGVSIEQHVELRFDDYLDAGQELDSTNVVIIGPDSLPVPVAAVTIGAPRPAPTDTAAPADTVALPDTVALADTVAPVDTAASPTPALPSQLVVVELAEGVELIPEAEYRVSARGMRNIVGLIGDAEGEFTAPELPPEPVEELAPDTIPGQGAGPDTTPALPPDTIPPPGPVSDTVPEPEPAQRP